MATRTSTRVSGNSEEWGGLKGSITIAALEHLRICLLALGDGGYWDISPKSALEALRSVNEALDESSEMQVNRLDAAIARNVELMLANHAEHSRTISSVLRSVDADVAHIFGNALWIFARGGKKESGSHASYPFEIHVDHESCSNRWAATRLVSSERRSGFRSARTDWSRMHQKARRLRHARLVVRKRC
jgi:hypothetical protein